MAVTFGGFCTVCMAGHTFGKIMSPLGMPSITLFIFFGLVCGPVGFELVTRPDSDMLAWISDLALGFIGACISPDLPRSPRPPPCIRDMALGVAASLDRMSRPSTYPPARCLCLHRAPAHPPACCLLPAACCLLLTPGVRVMRAQASRQVATST